MPESGQIVLLQWVWVTQSTSHGAGNGKSIGGKEIEAAITAGGAAGAGPGAGKETDGTGTIGGTDAITVAETGTAGMIAAIVGTTAGTETVIEIVTATGAAVTGIETTTNF